MSTLMARLPRKPLLPRDMGESHRAASALELFFDLCFVVAVSQAASRLHHAYLADQLTASLENYFFVFFAIWWAWMNFTWFASAYDNDSPSYRLVVAVQIAGILIIAAGVPRAFDLRDPTIMTIGYCVMRVAQGTQWLRVARSDPERKKTALRYGGGQLAMQPLWISLLYVDGEWFMKYALLLIVLELAIPAWAETAGATTWHPSHISERYSLFFLIVLGESVLATTVAIQAAIDDNIAVNDLLSVMIGGFVVVFSMWWLYFFRPGHEMLRQGPVAFLWGYGHYFIFAATAAVGAGLEVAVDRAANLAQKPSTGGHGESVATAADSTEHVISATGAHLALAVPVAVFLLGLWALFWPDANHKSWRWWQLPATAAAIVVAALTPAAYWLMALLIATSLTVKVLAHERSEDLHV